MTVDGGMHVRRTKIAVLRSGAAEYLPCPGRVRAHSGTSTANACPAAEPVSVPPASTRERWAWECG
jgi:hypothetical protein